MHTKPQEATPRSAAAAGGEIHKTRRELAEIERKREDNKPHLHLIYTPPHVLPPPARHEARKPPPQHVTRGNQRPLPAVWSSYEGERAQREEFMYRFSPCTASSKAAKRLCI
ncbi:hypothetical protein E2C01_074789 [Portunus trituberculatus]|uniref:Uncharacterized protein n=1 Tax=Portunus trituberculatus TaxID=210409 RepID=A0A5B7IF71_PORTR|nr:hypothetical protein [Portunus trituberculatus]